VVASLSLGLVGDVQEVLFRSAVGQVGQLTDIPLEQSDMHRLIRRQRGPDRGRLLHLPGHKDYRVSAQRGGTRCDPADGQP
jgi:hypothetical protein